MGEFWENWGNLIKKFERWTGRNPKRAMEGSGPKNGAKPKRGFKKPIWGDTGILIKLLLGEKPGIF